jgi:hypothetical protein
MGLCLVFIEFEVIFIMFFSAAFAILHVYYNEI